MRIKIWLSCRYCGKLLDTDDQIDHEIVVHGFEWQKERKKATKEEKDAN